MKKFALVFVFFFLLSSGIVLFFVSQTKKTQDIASQAKEGNIATLPLLVDDCNVTFHPECLPPGGLGNPRIMQSIIESVLQKQPNTTFASYKEKYIPADYPFLLDSVQTNEVELTVPEMMTKVSAHTLVSYELLLTLIAIENPSLLANTDANPHHPYGLDTKSVLAEFSEVADNMAANMQNTVDPQFRIKNKTYQMGANLNQGSKVVYSYLASTSTTPEIFERKIKDFPIQWQKLLGEKPLTDKPNFLETKEEKPLPITPGEFPATRDGDPQVPATQSGQQVENLLSQ